MVSTGDDLKEILLGESAVFSRSGSPKIVLDFSTISVEESADIRVPLLERGREFIASSVSGNGKCVKAGKLRAVASGPRGAFDKVEGILSVIAGNGVSYVGEGELARFCRITHNIFLGVVTQNLAEDIVLGEKAGVPRSSFLDFMNNSVLGSVFTRYKTHAFVNLDWTTTFTPGILRKDLGIGLESARSLEMPMPVAAATREALQAHFGAANLQEDAESYLQMDFAAVLETVALAAGVKLESERFVSNGSGKSGGAVRKTVKIEVKL